MAKVLNVNPTRMELSKLKKRLATARRGHKLLKDKRDELMRQFLDLVRENKTLRKKVEEGLREANKSLALARGIMSDQVAETALLCPSQEVTLELGSKNIMSVDVPVYTAKTRTPNEDDIFCYGLAFTPVELDSAISELNSLLPDLLRLAQVEKSVQMMAVEIEKTRRRVNALEHVMIPRYVDTIRMITMKLDENERSNTARLMKVKDMMIQEQYSAKQQA
ncbi:MAG: V-type ATP synthase subunit D [Ruminococcaceae bacterium]|nr:V-type ATP synthase subunit D [Oscillospiraceae bacterium]